MFSLVILKSNHLVVVDSVHHYYQSDYLDIHPSHQITISIVRLSKFINRTHVRIRCIATISYPASPKPNNSNNNNDTELYGPKDNDTIAIVIIKIVIVLPIMRILIHIEK